MADRAQITAMDQKLAAKQKEGADLLQSAYDEVKKGYFPEEKLKDAAGAPLSTSSWGEKIRAIKAESEAIGRERETLMLAYQAEADFKRATGSSVDGGGADPRGGDQGADPGLENRGKKLVKTFGQLFTEHPEFKANHAKRTRSNWGMEFPDFEVKTLFETGAGWAAESLRTGRVVEYADRPIQLIDTMPMDTTQFNAVVYMEETTQSLGNVVEKAEGNAYGEPQFVLTQRTVAVENLPAFIPVTEEQLEDVAQVQSWLDRKLRYALLRRLDNQLINGTGVTPLLTGVSAASGLQTQALGAYPVPDAYMRAMTKVRTTGAAIPSAVWAHPTDVQNLMLLRDGMGNYLWGKPSEAGPRFIWGVPLVEGQAATQGTAYTGAFRDYSRIVTRKGIVVEVGLNDDDFSKGKKTVRANMRVAVVWERGTAFCSVTGLPA